MKDRRASEGGDAKLGLETMVPGRDIEKLTILEPWRQGCRNDCADRAEDERKGSGIEWQQGCEKHENLAKVSKL